MSGKPRYDPRAHGANCDMCPLRGTPVIAPEGDLAAASIMIVGEAPGFNELKQGKPFVGAAGLKLGELLYHAKVKRTELFVTNACLCRPIIPEGEGVEGAKRFDAKSYRAWLRMKNAKAAKAARGSGVTPDLMSDPWDCCAPRLWRELHAFEQAAVQRGQPNGGVVVPLGNYAIKSIIAREGIQKLRGSPIVVDVNNPTKTDAERTRELAGPDPEGLAETENDE